MEFATPWGFLALLSMLVILALYALRPRRTEVRVSATHLWHEALQERSRGTGLRRLLRDASLFIALLGAALLSFSLADPRWTTDAGAPEELVLIIDNSASMQAQAQRGTRLDQAKKRARELVGAMPSGGRTLLMQSGATARLISAFESDNLKLYAALDELEPTDEVGQPDDALELGLSLLANRANGRVLFLTDGAYTTKRVAPLPGPVTVEVLSGLDADERGNVAITRFDVRPEPGTEERFQVLVSMRNYRSTLMRVPVLIELNGEVLLDETVQLEANGGKTLVRAFEGRALGRAQATIDVDDALPSDDRAYAVLRADPPLRVLLYGGENVYLHTAMRALPGVSVTRLEEFRADRFTALEQQHDVVVFDRIPPPDFQHGSFLVIDTLPPGLPFTTRGWVNGPQATGRGTGPIARGLAVAGMKVERARQVRGDTSEAAGVQRLLWSERTDLALSFLDTKRRLVYIGFDIAASNIALQAAFPLFLQDVFDWLSGRGSTLTKSQVLGRTQTQIKAGVPVAMLAPVGDGGTPPSTVDVTAPRQMFSVTPHAGVADFRNTNQAGFYEVRQGDETFSFAVNLTDESESDIRPRARSRAALRTASAAAGTAVARAIWPYLLMVVLAFFAFDAWYRNVRPWVRPDA
ncbi:MAG: hypothetical protein ACI8PT_001376 [Gammaproteobacteria bacterium]|jgi:hypothetical protein